MSEQEAKQQAIILAELLDEKIILQKFGEEDKTELLEKLFYDIEFEYRDKKTQQMKISRMQGISVNGATFIVQYMVTSGKWKYLGEVSREVTFDEPNQRYEARVKVKAEHINGTVYEPTGESFYEITGGKQDRFGKIIAQNKALRNAWRQVIPESLILQMMKQYQERVHHEALADSETKGLPSAKSTGKFCAHPDCGKEISERSLVTIEGVDYHLYCYLKINPHYKFQ